MTNCGKNKPAQTYEQMVENGKQSKNSKLYKAESAAFVDSQLSALVGWSAKTLAEAATAEPVSLRDTEDVKKRTMIYLQACEETATFPSIAGLARSMGLSRQAIYDCIGRRSPAKTAEWLEMCRDCFSDILAQSALRNNCNTITAIFLQKAVYGLRETIEVVAKQPENPLGPEVDQEALEARIMATIIDCD